MALAPFSIRKVENMLENGHSTKWKAEELFTTLVEVLLMKENGKEINFMGMECSIINVLDILLRNILGKIWIELIVIGSNMKEISNKILSMDKEHSTYQMDNTLLENLKMIYLMELESSKLLRISGLKEDGIREYFNIQDEMMII